MAKKEIPEDEGVSQEWLASYADAMTLLLAFFIMMFAFALIDEGKFFDFKVGVVAALGVPDPLTDNTDSILAKGSGITPEVGLTPLRPSDDQRLSLEETVQALSDAGLVTEDNAEDLKKALEIEIEVAGATEYVEVGIDERGVFIRFKNRVLFSSGSADLDQDGLIVLAKVSEVLTNIDNYLEVEGHTDSQPTNGGAWPTNWELSAVRSAGVIRFMIDTGGLPANRLTLIGHEATRPIAVNTTDEGRTENRRVEIVVRLAEVDAGPLEQPESAEDVLGVDIESPDVLSQEAEESEGTDEAGADPEDGESVDPEDGESGESAGNDEEGEEVGDGGDITDIDPIPDPISDPINPALGG